MTIEIVIKKQNERNINFGLEVIGSTALASGAGAARLTGLAFLALFALGAAGFFSSGSARTAKKLFLDMFTIEFI
jgi:hypothetical protein